MVHVRRIEGRPLNFGHSGWLWKEAYLLYDHATESLWHNQSGRALAGPLRGKALARLPTTLATWADWSREHPDTRVLPKPADPRATVDLFDEHNRSQEFGLAVEVPGGHRLYRLEDIASAGVLADELTGVPVVLAVHAGGRSASAFDRRLGGETLAFELADAGSGRSLLAEAGGSRRWNLPGGTPVPASGARLPLERVLGTVWNVRAWVAQHPRGSIWEL